MASLAFDTSDHGLLVALIEKGNVLDQIEEESWQRQSEFLVPKIEALLLRNERKIEDMDSFIVSKGPGSYTGVRVALTVAKVLSFDLNKPLYLVSSLKLLRKPGKKCLCLMNARASRSYAGVYDEDGNCLLEDKVMSNDEVFAYLEEHPDVIPCGYLEYLSLPSSSVRLALNFALEEKEENKIDDPLKARPVYLKETYLR